MAGEQIAPTEEIQATPKEEEIASPVEEKKEKAWFKLLLFSISGLLLVTGLVFAGYKFAQKEAQPTPQPSPVITPTPTPDPTAGWNTYTNTEVAYSIRYPKDWFQSVGMEGVVFYNIKESRETEEEGFSKDLVVIRVSFERTYKNLSLEEYLEELLKGLGIPVGAPPGTKILEKQYKKIDSKDALITTLDPRETLTESYSMERLAIIRVDSNKFIRLFLEPHFQKNYEKAVPIFNLMLSTFKFLPSAGSGQGE